MSRTSLKTLLRSSSPPGFSGSVGFTGSSGFTGSRGETGIFGGVTFAYKFSRNVDSSQDPGLGHLKFNDTSMLSATQLYIKNVDVGGANIDAYLDSVAASTSEVRGYFKLFNSLRPENFVIFAITGASEKIDDYYILTCAYVSGDLTDSSTSFEEDDDVLISFERTGDRGSTGFTGSRGAPGSSVRLLGSVQTVQDLPLNAEPGDGYIVLSNGDLYIFNGGQWTNIGKITGDTGPTGFTGSRGIPGEFAAIGFTGSRGFDGVNGFTGSVGFVGSRGVIGYTGSRGADGTAVDIVGSAASYAALPSPYNGNVGDGYLTEDNGHLNVWMGSSWLDVGAIRGYTGSVGRLETWTKIISNYTAENNQRLIADTTAGSFTVTLPANPTLGYYVVITDGADWAANPLLIDGNGNEVEYQMDQVSLDIADVTVEFIWNVSSWEVTATLGARGEPGYTGSRGLPGEAAFVGYTGSEGFTGSQGELGFSGSQGNIGYTGSQGELSVAQAIGFAIALGG